MRTITVGEAAKILGLSRREVLALIKQQQLRARRENFHWLVDADSVARIAQQRLRQAAPAVAKEVVQGELLSARQAAQLLGVTPHMVRTYIRNGQLRAYRDPHTSEYRIRYEDLAEFARWHALTRPPSSDTLQREGYITVPEAARRLGISRSRLYEILRLGTIATLRFGRRYLVELRSLEEYKRNGRVTSI